MISTVESVFIIVWLTGFILSFILYLLDVFVAGRKFCDKEIEDEYGCDEPAPWGLVTIVPIGNWLMAIGILNEWFSRRYESNLFKRFFISIDDQYKYLVKKSMEEK